MQWLSLMHLEVGLMLVARFTQFYVINSETIANAERHYSVFISFFYLLLYR